MSINPGAFKRILVDKKFFGLFLAQIYGSNVNVLLIFINIFIMAATKIFLRDVSFCMLHNYLKICKIPGNFIQTSKLKNSLFCLSSYRFQHIEPSSTPFAVKEKPESVKDPGNYPENKFVEMRTHTCGSLRDSDVGLVIRICGWIQFSRMNRFITLRDGYGTTQVVIPDERNDLSRKLNGLPFESVLAVKGHVVKRPAGQENPKMATGLIEVVADDISILNHAKKDLPFSIREFNKAKESLQMKYRYLSLRFPELQHNLRLRSHLLNLMREFLIRKCSFVEVETPTLFRKTPGGAQEFVVPTQQKGHFYSLVQSPQQLKQLLMVGAIDRYFQVARCYRDETARPDRQPEFTQMDIEVSFSNREGIIHLVEELLENSWHSTVGKANSPPFPRISYNDALSMYGSDKPDNRFGLKLTDITKTLLSIGSSSKPMELLKQHSSFVAICFTIPKYLEQGLLSRTNFKKFEETLRKSMINIKSVRFFPDRFKNKNNTNDLELLQGHLAANLDEWNIIAVGDKDEVLPFLGRLRLIVADHLESKGVKVRSEGFNFLWVVDFPLFIPAENSNDKSAIESAHHPFTQPHPEDIHLLEAKPLEVRGLHYDLVCNGCEVGGGSVRIHDAALQCSILDKLGINKSCLSHLIEALSCGCPPHAGIALGVDRLMALAVGAETVREVIAFPKGSVGQDIMSGSPSILSQEELDLYHIRLKES